MQTSGKAAAIWKLAFLACVGLDAGVSTAHAAPEKAPARAQPAVLFVFDASGSMLRPLNGRPKAEVARSVMESTLSRLPSEVKVGLLSFGHRRKKDCSDLELVAGVGTERARVAGIVHGLESKGETPLAEAVRRATRELQGYAGEASIVVVSDGKDECGGDPCAAAREAIGAGLDIRIHVVGFDVGKAEATELQCIAREGKGKYFSAASANQLSSALSEVERTIVEPPAAAGPRCKAPKRGSTQPVTCKCSPEQTHAGSVWGADLYTDDSAVCRAALHAGVISAAGGNVTVYPYAGQDSYDGAERNGVYSSDYGEYPGSFGFSDKLQPRTGGCPPSFTRHAKEAEPFSCECRAKGLEGGNVWGTDVYTADSSICRAAVHAGVLREPGGPVTLYPQPGQASYDGSERNGITSRDYGNYGRSFAFRPDPPRELARCLYGNLEAGKPVACRCRASDTTSGGLWGTDVYTSDSSICAAAVHAGLLTSDGGVVKVIAGPAQPSFAGSVRNGVSSSKYGPWKGSFTFEK